MEYIIFCPVYPLKTLQIQKFSNVFRGQEKRPVAWNGINCYERCGVPKVHSLKGHSMWNGPNFREVPTSPSWILLKFCQCTHQEMKILKILLPSRGRFQNYSHLNYGPVSLDIESLQFMTFWKCSYLESFNSKDLTEILNSDLFSGSIYYKKPF